MWSTLIFLACGLYAVIPLSTFRVWSIAMPAFFGVPFVLIFTLSGGGSHALFLVIALVFGTIYGVICNLVVTAILQKAGWLKWVVALFVAYFAQIWALAQAIGFSADFC